MNFLTVLILIAGFVANHKKILDGYWFRDQDLKIFKNEFWFYRSTFGKIVNIFWLAFCSPSLIFMYIAKVIVNLY